MRAPLRQPGGRDRICRSPDAASHAHCHQVHHRGRGRHGARARQVPGPGAIYNQRTGRRLRRVARGDLVCDASALHLSRLPGDACVPAHVVSAAHRARRRRPERGDTAAHDNQLVAASGLDAGARAVLPRSDGDRAAERQGVRRRSAARRVQSRNLRVPRGAVRRRVSTHTRPRGPNGAVRAGVAGDLCRAPAGPWAAALRLLAGGPEPR